VTLLSLEKAPLGVFLLLALAGAPSASAQLVPEVAPFSTVRLRSPVYSGEATLLSIGPDSLQVGIQGLSRSIGIPIASISRLEYRRPARARERAVRGALWGAGIFAVTGALFPDPVEDASPVEMAVVYAIPGAIIGAVIGLAIRSTRWERVVVMTPANGRR
jgi:hypothetical protein